MQEDLDVVQRIGGGPADVGPDPCLTERGDYSVFVELTVDPCQVPEARGGERLHLMVIVIEERKVEILRFPPVAIVTRASGCLVWCRGTSMSKVPSPVEPGFPSRSSAPVGRRPPGPSGAPHWTNDLDQACRVWRPPVRGGQARVGWCRAGGPARRRHRCLLPTDRATAQPWRG
jgi:hypothetical protein